MYLASPSRYSCPYVDGNSRCSAGWRRRHYHRRNSRGGDDAVRGGERRTRACRTRGRDGPCNARMGPSVVEKVKKHPRQAVCMTALTMYINRSAVESAKASCAESSRDKAVWRV